MSSSGIESNVSLLIALPRIRTFKLFEHLKTPLIDYYMSSEKQPSRYNDKTMIGEVKEDPDYFKVSDVHGGRIMAEWVFATYQ